MGKKTESRGSQKVVEKEVFFLSPSSGNEFSLSGAARGTLTVGLEENTLAPRLFPEKSTPNRRSLGGTDIPGQQESASSAGVCLSGMIIY